MPVRVLDGSAGSEQSTAEGIIWAADHGADVIVVALQFYDGTQALADAIAHAAANDALVIAPTGHTGLGIVAYPAAMEACLAVASTDSNDLAAEFSNFGQGA